MIAGTSRFVQNSIRDCKATGEWQQAMHYLNTSQEGKVETNLLMYNLAIGACEKAMVWYIAVQLLRCLGVADIISFTAAMNVLGRAGQWQRALDLLQDLETVCMQANLLTWNTCISATGRASAWQQGMAMLKAWSIKRGFTNKLPKKTRKTRLLLQDLKHSFCCQAKSNLNLWKLAWTVLQFCGGDPEPRTGSGYDPRT